MTPRRNPLLQPYHFGGGGLLQLGPAGLKFVVQVDHGEREFECLVSGLADHEIERMLASSIDRNPARVILNPRRPALRRLVERVQLDRGASLRDGVSPLSGLPKRIDRGWRFEVRPGADFSVEGQGLLMVAVVAGEPVGFFSGSAGVLVDGAHQVVELSIGADMVYVVPRFRGQGYSMDLSVATGWMVRELLEAAYAAAPCRTTLDVTLRADIRSTGGDHFVRKLAECLEYQLELLQEHGLRRTVRPGRLELYAGW